jgi:preprotein translocase SecE subunit
MSNQASDIKRSDQGRIARLAVFWSLAVLIYYGCTSLRALLVGRFTKNSALDLASPLFPSVPKIPVLGAELTGALLIAVVVFAAATFFVWRWIERPKTSNLLAETEVELRKVTWPTGQEVFNSSVVVVVCVAFLMAFLAGADYVLAKLAGIVLFGGA